MLGYKVMQAGVQGLAVQAICMDSLTGISAAGTNAATAAVLANAVNFVGTTASGAGVILPASSSPGDGVFIFNGGANPLNVYPTTGSQINGLSVNAAATIGTNSACEFWMGSLTQWGAILSA